MFTLLFHILSSGDLSSAKKKLSSSSSTWFTISFLTSGRSAVHFNNCLCRIAFILVPSICLFLVAFRTLQVSLAQVETHIPMICNQYCLVFQLSHLIQYMIYNFFWKVNRSFELLPVLTHIYVGPICLFMVAYGTL